MSARRADGAVPVIAANWKMHNGPSATRAFFEAFQSGYSPRDDRRIVFFPPAVSLVVAREVSGWRRDLEIGVQNIHWEAKGAFTGEISAPMAREAGARVALVGHSERRHVFGETDEETCRKVAAAFAAELTPMLCLGETIEQRRADELEAVILRQLDAVIGRIDPGQVARLMIAYEPVWAIGTGETATPDDASRAHGILRRRLNEAVGDEAARRIPLLYGGSVKPGNAAELLAADDVDGVLVGGASLVPQDFAAIATALP